MQFSQTRNQPGRVITARQPENPDPLSVKAGEELQVSETRDAWQDNPEWVWVFCTDPRGKSAWAPADLLQSSEGKELHRARAGYSYDAVELAVMAGDDLVVIGEKNGWSWCTNSQGEEGWVPTDHITLVDR